MYDILSIFYVTYTSYVITVVITDRAHMCGDGGDKLFAIFFFRNFGSL